jgi:hypothetical protein
VHLVDIDDVGAQPPQRVLDLPPNALRARIAEHLSVSPIEADLGGDLHLVAQATLGERLPDDLFGAAEAVYRCRVDQRYAAVDGRADRGDRLGLIRAAPHPAADRPCAKADTRRH